MPQALSRVIKTRRGNADKMCRFKGNISNIRLAFGYLGEVTVRVYVGATLFAVGSAVLKLHGPYSIPPHGASPTTASRLDKIFPRLHNSGIILFGHGK